MTPSQRLDVEAGLFELMVLAEITMALGNSEIGDYPEELPKTWVTWIGEQTHRIVHMVRTDLGDIPS